jgi:uncharacterized membrane protein
VDVQRLGFGLTNAQKGLVSAVVSACLSLAVAFGLSITADQTAAIVTFVNALLGLWIGLTAGNSPALREGVNPLTGKS